LFVADGEVRDGAWVAEVTDLLDLSKWPAGMRVIVRKERPHAGAQLRLTDAYGRRLTTFATNTARGQFWPIWSCGTAARLPGARTGSGARRTPG